MKYKVSFKLDKGDGDSIQVRSFVEIGKSGCFSYGNGKYLVIKPVSGIENDMVFDIRYNKDYDSNDEVSYIKHFIEGIWTGKDGGYKAKYINIKKVFQLEDK